MNYIEGEFTHNVENDYDLDIKFTCGYEDDYLTSDETAYPGPVTYLDNAEITILYGQLDLTKHVKVLADDVYQDIKTEVFIRIEKSLESLLTGE